VIQRPRPRPSREAPRSLIAGANALFRMKETTRADRILADPWAGELAEDHLLVRAIRFSRFALPPLWRAVDELQTAHCVRHRAIDELVLRAVGDGFKQIVLVGAGYDMRASRFADRLEGVRVIELDLPSTAERKRERLRGLPGVNSRVEYAAVDLETQTIGDALAETRFRRSLPTLFVLEGLIHYLPRRRVRALFAELASGPQRRRVALSFIRPEEYRRAGGPLRAMIGALREVPKLTYSHAQLRHESDRAGFSRCEMWTFADQVDEFAPTARFRRVGASQDVAQLD
jgi:methyltransferase (TIGR00027 family)